MFVRIIAFCLILAGTLCPGLARAQEMTADGIAYTHVPEYVLIDYTATKKSLEMTVTALPYIDACGRVMPLPVKSHLDGEFAEVVVGDYKFIRPLGTGKHNCGPVNKASAATIRFDRAELAAQGITTIRVWHGSTFDTFPLRTVKKDLVIGMPYDPRFANLAPAAAARAEKISSAQ